MDDTVTRDPTQVAAEDSTAVHDETTLADLVLGEWDFEEVSVDGICGVY